VKFAKLSKIEAAIAAVPVNRDDPCRSIRAERDLLRRIAAGACLRVAGLEIIVAKLRGKGGAK